MWGRSGLTGGEGKTRAAVAPRAQAQKGRRTHGREASGGGRRVGVCAEAGKSPEWEAGRRKDGNSSKTRKKGP